jgi:hypothetical protein
MHTLRDAKNEENREDNKDVLRNNGEGETYVQVGMHKE